MSRKSKRRGSSKAGRPRKDGDRYLSGKLKPPKPNKTVVERRLAGDSAAGGHPLDFALAQNWIGQREHRAGMTYTATFNRSCSGIGPRLAMQRIPEAPESETLRLNWSQLSDEEITSIFDQVFSITGAPEDKVTREEAAQTLWKRLNLALCAEEREELFMICVLGSWPLWMPRKAADRALGSKDIRKEATLLAGLNVISRSLRPKAAELGAIIPLPFRRKCLRIAHYEQPVRYETTDGQEITPLSQRGFPFEVTILRKRA